MGYACLCGHVRVARLLGAGATPEHARTRYARSKRYRVLADARPDAFAPDLAGSLNNLSNGPGDLGPREDAAAVHEGASVFMQLSTQQPRTTNTS